ncbi:MAG: hypothetical protein ACRBI6_04710 [Acidimicrobiales bacterium]
MNRDDLSPDQLAEVLTLRTQLKDDLPRYFEEWLRIVDRDNPLGVQVIPFKLNACQTALHRTIERIERLNLKMSAKINEHDPLHPISALPLELVILKARKMGVSTYLAGRAMHKCEFNQRFTSGIMSHKGDSSENIANILSGFHYSMPDRAYDPHTGEPRPHWREKITRTSGKIVKWHDSWGSKCHVKTAGSSDGASRSYTYQFLHISEEAHFGASDEVSSAIAACVPFREIFEESTANGEGNMFHRNWENALYIEEAERMFEAGEAFPENWNKKFKFFWAWHQDPSYRKGCTTEQAEAIMATLDDEERYLMETFNCTVEQLNWRRDKIMGECQNQQLMDPLDNFHQEYPSTPGEAFVSKGDNVFDQKKLSLFGKMAAKQDLDKIRYGRFYRDNETKWDLLDSSPSNATYFEFKKPKKNEAYTVGADSAEGLEGGDFSVISVWRRANMMFAEQVAIFRGKVSGEETAELAVQIAKYYNNAFIVPEVNGGSGAAMCLKINRLGYGMVHHRKNPEQFKDRNDPNSFTIGFKTTALTKKLITDQGAGYLKNDNMMLRSKYSISEWKNFRVVDGKAGAPEGENDDCVMADLLALFGHFRTESGAPPLQAVLKMQKRAESLEEKKAAEKESRVKALHRQKARWQRQAKARDRKEQALDRFRRMSNQAW